METVNQTKVENNILERLGNLEARLESLMRRNAEGDALSEFAPDGGQLTGADFGGAVLDETGIHTDANVVDINWWLPLNLANDNVTYIYAVAYDGVEWVYVGGQFTKIGGVYANNIARYSLITRNWEAMGTGANGGTPASVVRAIAIADSSNVYICGQFASVNNVANTSGVAKWNGTVWSALGTGSGSTWYALAVSGSQLYVAGFGTTMGGVTVNRVARWSGSAWFAMGSGLDSDTGYALAVIGSDVYVSGNFTGASGVANTAYIAKWNGSAWSSVGVFNGTVRGLYYDTASTYLYAVGEFTTITGYTDVVRVARYDGANWSGLNTGIDNGIVYTVTVDVNGNPVTGGSFTNAGGNALADKVAIFENGEWEELSNAGGTSGLDGIVYALLILSNGSIVTGGSFNFAGAIQCQSIAVYCKPLSDAIDIIASLFELYAPSEGTYTPTLSNTTNVAASTAYVTAYQRVGNIVHVFGQVDADPTAGATSTSLGMSLPIASTFVNDYDLGGTGAVNNTTASREAVGIFANTSNGNAQFNWLSPDGANRTIRFHFSYRVL